MATKIEWTKFKGEGYTWNPIVSGCKIISEGCSNCYAMNMARRLEAMGQEKYEGLTRKTTKGNVVWNGEVRIDMDDPKLLEPLKKKTPSTYFVNSMTDLFQEGVPFEAIDKIMAVIALTPQHTYQVLTKRPERMKEYFVQKRQLFFYIKDMNNAYHFYKKVYKNGSIDNFLNNGVVERRKAIEDENLVYSDVEFFYNGILPLPNLWLGVSVENENHLPRVDVLRDIPAAVRFISFEPLLSNIKNINLQNIHWAIAGGESGKGARPMLPDWVRSIRDQCQTAQVPFFFKQWGEYAPYEETAQPPFWYNSSTGKEIDVHHLNYDIDDFYIDANPNFDDKVHFLKVGKTAAGKKLDGQVWQEFPKIQ